MLPKKSSNRPFIFMLIIFCIATVYFGLHYTMLHGIAVDEELWGNVIEGGQVDAFTLMDYTVKHIQKSPFDLSMLNIFDGIKTSLMIIVVYLIVGTLVVTHHNMMKQDAAGKEKGSSKWFTDMKFYNERFTDPYSKWEKKLGIPDNNIPLAQGLMLSMDTRYTNRNLNVMVVGGSGTGKSYLYVKPSLAQMNNSSFVCTDPSGELMQAMGIALLEDGYNLKLFSISDMQHTCCYNPMDYIYDETGAISQTKVDVLVSTFIKNAGDVQKGKGGGDPFWIKSSTAWLTFAVLYLAEFEPIENRNMYNILKLAQKGKADEGSSSSQTALDEFVNVARSKNPNASCFHSYDTFKLAPAKTANSILISIAVDLNLFASDDVRNMTTTSYLCERTKTGIITKYIRDKNGQPIRDSRNLDLGAIGNSRTALFINIPQANAAYDFIIAMMYSQLFAELYSVAERVAPNTYNLYDGRNMIIEGGFKTKEEAERSLEIYQNATVCEDVIDGVTRYFIYSDEKDAPILPEFIGSRKRRYIKEVYSRAVGEKLLSHYQEMEALLYPDQKKYQKKKEKERQKYLHDTKGMSQEEVQAYIEKKNDEEAEYLRDHPADRKKQVKRAPGLFYRPKIIKSSPYVKRGELRLPVHVRFILDEFNNLGEIPSFDRMLSTMRKYEISCTIILQSLTQIHAKYDKLWKTLVGNCDSFVFLGSSEDETAKYVSDTIGTATIRVIDNSQSKSAKSGSVSTSFKRDSRKLLDQTEVQKIDNQDCIVFIRGLDPFYKHKYAFNHHPNYYKTGDANPNKKIDMKFLDRFFKCLPKARDDQAIAMAEEQQAKEDQLKSQRRKSAAKTKKPITDKVSMEEDLNLKKDTLDQEMTQVISVDPKDYEDTTSSVEPIPADFDASAMFTTEAEEDQALVEEVIAAPGADSESSKKKNKPKKNIPADESLPASTSSSGPINGPEAVSDDSWLFS